MSSKQVLHNEETSVSTLVYSKPLSLLKKKHSLEETVKITNDIIPPLKADKISSSSSNKKSSSRTEIVKMDFSSSDCLICLSSENENIKEVAAPSFSHLRKFLTCTICNYKVHYQCLKDMKKLQKKPLGISQEETQFLCEGCSYSLSNYELNKCFVCGNKGILFMLNDQMAHFFCYIIHLLKLKNKQSKICDKADKCTVCPDKQRKYNPLITCDFPGCEGNIHLSCLLNPSELLSVELIKTLSKYLLHILKFSKISNEKLFFCTGHQSENANTLFPEVNKSLSNPTIYTKESSFGDESKFKIKQEKKQGKDSSITRSKNNNLSFNEALDKIDEVISKDISNLSNGSQLNLNDYTKLKSFIKKVIVNYSAIDSELEDLK